MKEKLINKISQFVPVFIFFAYLNNYFFYSILFSKFKIPSQFIEFNISSIFDTNTSISLFLFFIFLIIYSLVCTTMDLFNYKRADLITILVISLVARFLFNYRESVINYLIIIISLTIVADIIKTVVNSKKEKTNNTKNENKKKTNLFLPTVIFLTILYISIMTFSCNKVINTRLFSFFQYNNKTYINIGIYNDTLISKEYNEEQKVIREGFKLIKIDSNIKFWSNKLDNINILTDEQFENKTK